MVNIVLNGEPYMLQASCSLSDLIGQLRVSGRFAIELNQQIINARDLTNYLLQSGDKVEIVQAIGGG